MTDSGSRSGGAASASFSPIAGLRAGDFEATCRRQSQVEAQSLNASDCGEIGGQTGIYIASNRHVALSVTARLLARPAGLARSREAAPSHVADFVIITARRWSWPSPADGSQFSIRLIMARLVGQHGC